MINKSISSLDIVDGIVICGRGREGEEREGEEGLGEKVFILLMLLSSPTIVSWRWAAVQEHEFNISHKHPFNGFGAKYIYI